VRLRIRRLGGLAGVTLHKQFDTAELPGERASQVEGAVRNLDKYAATQPPRPDAFRYEITHLDHPHQASVVVNDQDVPAELRPLIQAVSKEGEIESRKSSRGRDDD
jgi:emfourin